MIANRLIGHSVARPLAPVSVAGLSLFVLAAPNPDRFSPASAVGPELDVKRGTIDGGGAIFSTGGDFELSGTIGQHDAGTLIGGDYELNGGFWFPITTGDCNIDGIVNLFDYALFTDCVTGPGLGPVAPACECDDYDQDGDVDLLDWSILQMEFGH